MSFYLKSKKFLPSTKIGAVCFHDTSIIPRSTEAFACLDRQFSLEPKQLFYLERFAKAKHQNSLPSMEFRLIGHSVNISISRMFHWKVHDYPLTKSILIWGLPGENCSINERLSIPRSIGVLDRSRSSGNKYLQKLSLERIKTDQQLTAGHLTCRLKCSKPSMSEPFYHYCCKCVFIWLKTYQRMMPFLFTQGEKPLWNGLLFIKSKDELIGETSFKNLVGCQRNEWNWKCTPFLCLMIMTRLDIITFISWFMQKHNALVWLFLCDVWTRWEAEFQKANQAKSSELWLVHLTRCSGFFCFFDG